MRIDTGVLGLMGEVEEALEPGNFFLRLGGVMDLLDRCEELSDSRDKSGGDERERELS